jgi:hypothetical protein
MQKSIIYYLVLIKLLFLTATLKSIISTHILEIIWFVIYILNEINDTLVHHTRRFVVKTYLKGIHIFCFCYDDCIE